MEHTGTMMRADTHIQRILDLAKKQGIVRSIDLDAIGAPRIALTRMTQSGQLERAGRGLYRLPGALGSESDSLSIVAAKVPRGVFCLLTALQFHELTTQLPRRVWIAMPRGSHLPQIDYPPLTMVQLNDESHAAGIEIHERDQAELRVYGVAKTIADCFKFRNKVGLDVALEALRDAHAKSKVTIDELWHFAQICRVANVMRPYLESLP
jgi:predicted transcriptional regulator of viral defense system